MRFFIVKRKIRDRKMKKKLIKIIVGIVAIAIIILAFIWNRYFVKTSLFAEYISPKGQEVYILGAIHRR